MFTVCTCKWMRHIKSLQHKSMKTNPTKYNIYHHYLCVLLRFYWVIHYLFTLYVISGGGPLRMVLLVEYCNRKWSNTGVFLAYSLVRISTVAGWGYSDPRIYQIKIILVLSITKHYAAQGYNDATSNHITR